MKRLVAPLMTFLAIGTLANSAVAPSSPERLKEISSHIIEGTVTEIKTEIAGSPSALDEIKGKLGGKSNTNTVYKIKIKVTGVSKGEDVEVGDEVTIQAWTPRTRPLPEPGPQGHSNIPSIGEKITVHTKKSGDVYKPIMPNGISKEK